MTPIRRVSNEPWNVSSRTRRTVEARARPEVCQSTSGTSDGPLGAAVVTTETTASLPSTHNTRTGRRLDARPLVNGTSATKNSPGVGIVVQAFILVAVTAEEGRMV